MVTLATLTPNAAGVRAKIPKNCKIIREPPGPAGQDGQEYEWLKRTFDSDSLCGMFLQHINKIEGGGRHRRSDELNSACVDIVSLI